MSREGQGLHRFRGAGESIAQAQAQFEAARILIRQGGLEEARVLLRACVQANPGLVDAWLHLAWLAQDPRERMVLLRQVLTVEPEQAQAKAELARMQPAIAPSPTSRNSATQPNRVWFLGTLVLLASLALLALLLWGPVGRSLAGLLPTPTPLVTPPPTLAPDQRAAQFEPQLQTALDTQNWDRALELVAIMRNIAPLSDDVQQAALEAHVKYGRALVEGGEVESALAQFDEAVSLDPADEDAQLWYTVSQLYLKGRNALNSGEWSAAVLLLAEAHELLPDYGDLAATVVEAYRLQGEAALEAGEWTDAIQSLTEARDRAPDDPELTALLASAYRKRGVEWQEQNEPEKARTDLETALALQPDDQEAKIHYDEVMDILFPRKRIEIDISSQRFYAYQDDELIYNFPTSTGLPGRDTAVGHFKVQSKEPMAYSSIWRLKMPYWLGIYYVGRIENGIHALPIRPDGTVMWAGLLGQKASYGCVILSTEAARIIYEWAEIGMPVYIHY